MELASSLMHNSLMKRYCYFPSTIKERKTPFRIKRFNYYWKNIHRGYQRKALHKMNMLMKSKSNNITVNKERVEDGSAARQIQAMTWDEILTQAGKPISRKQMLENLRKAQKEAAPPIALALVTLIHH